MNVRLLKSGNGVKSFVKVWTASQVSKSWPSATLNCRKIVKLKHVRVELLPRFVKSKHKSKKKPLKPLKPRELLRQESFELSSSKNSSEALGSGVRHSAFLPFSGLLFCLPSFLSPFFSISLLPLCCFCYRYLLTLLTTFQRYDTMIRKLCSTRPHRGPYSIQSNCHKTCYVTRTHRVIYLLQTNCYTKSHSNQLRLVLCPLQTYGYKKLSVRNIITLLAAYDPTATLISLPAATKEPNVPNKHCLIHFINFSNGSVHKDARHRRSLQ